MTLRICECGHTEGDHLRKRCSHVDCGCEKFKDNNKQENALLRWIAIILASFAAWFVGYIMGASQ